MPVVETSGPWRGQGHITTVTHDYYGARDGTLLAALNFLDGKILAEGAPRHRHQKWLKFLQTIPKGVPPGVDVPLTLDNHGTDKHPKVPRW